ncbi:DNA-binding SARP family transcriptional activator [Allocatelliglobosispora scoriae]|uniref:DNA-binding SARP family transcriptional activator n=1 Tax=Allocatelliglobosispora scoriae TaxID=643052 RepID=A0A841BK94_9ACTN|nr:BTAD domain-containing putative transcriptional regulator [Allocatelliglobosispora scoriae]MBB5867768.1 DNA-binding SARP family transcriptional activator [Allocatelliglobosispora scoriae]
MTITDAVSPTLPTFSCLGPVVVRAGRLDSVLIRSSAAGRLLAVFLVAANRPISRRQLVDELWGADPPRTAENALHVQVARLRRRLRAWEAPARIETGPGGYALRMAPQHLDIECFLGELRVADRLCETDPAQASAAAARATAMWRGEPFEGLDLGVMGRDARARLTELRLRALSLHAVTAMVCGRDSLVDLQSSVAAFPLHEEFVRMLMVALYRAGRQGDAITVYRDARARLVEELGAEPTPRLAATMADILRHESYLDDPVTMGVNPWLPSPCERVMS